MKCIELEKYKVAVIVDNSDMRSANINVDDILERTPKGRLYLVKLKKLAVETTDYEWPDCAYSLEMKIMSEERIMIVFSETIVDFVNGLKNSQKVAEHGSILLRELINHIETSDESTQRKIIRDFEKNIRDIQ